MSKLIPLRMLTFLVHFVLHLQLLVVFKPYLTSVPCIYSAPKMMNTHPEWAQQLEALMNYKLNAILRT